MQRQSFIFLFEPSTVRIEFHVVAGGDGITIESLHNPPRDPDRITVADPEAAAAAIRERVEAHETEHSARLSRIRWRGDDGPLSYLHVNFGVPIFPIDDGSER